jgi:signal transduction histidine kinase
VDGEVDFRALFEAAPGLYLVLAADLRIVAASDAYLRATATERGQIVGRHLLDVFPEPVGEPGASGAGGLAASLRRVLASGEPDTLPVRKHDMRRGREVGGGGIDERHWSRCSVPVLASDGRVSHIIHRVEDVTRTVELEETTAALRCAREKAEQASQLKTRFLGMVSHELRTPLTALSLQVERMQRHGDSLAPRHCESLQRIAFSAGRLREMIETLLEYARVEGGRVTMNIAPFDLGRAVSRIVENHRFHAERKGLAITCAVRTAAAIVSSDQRLVELVVSNLVDNAIKFTIAGTIDVVLSCAPEGTFRVAVRDSGPGIPEEQQSAIFEPFQQLGPPPCEHPPGIGLGLALVRDIATVLGGRIELASVPGDGSTFTLLLPPSVTGYPPA